MVQMPTLCKILCYHYRRGPCSHSFHTSLPLVLTAGVSVFPNTPGTLSGSLLSSPGPCCKQGASLSSTHNPPSTDVDCTEYQLFLLSTVKAPRVGMAPCSQLTLPAPRTGIGQAHILLDTWKTTSSQFHGSTNSRLGTQGQSIW